MVQNKSAVFLKFPSEFPVPGEHFAIQTKDLPTPVDLKPNSVLLRNLYFSLDPCNVPFPFLVFASSFSLRCREK
jgi:NADPH-dependent curcumin reductase CurA